MEVLLRHSSKSLPRKNFFYESGTSIRPPLPMLCYSYESCLLTLLREISTLCNIQQTLFTRRLWVQTAPRFFLTQTIILTCWENSSSYTYEDFPKDNAILRRKTARSITSIFYYARILLIKTQLSKKMEVKWTLRYSLLLV